MGTIKSGHRFERGDGAGYVAVRNIAPGDMLRSGDFKPFGGAPDLVQATESPGWLMSQVDLVLSDGVD